jgi:anti-sigma B factor antagonist
MKMSVEEHGNVVIVSPQGDVKVGEGDVALRDTIQRYLGEGRTRFVLDLGEVRFMDSAGLGELVASLKRVREAGGDLKVAQANQRISDALHVTQLVRVLDVYAEVAEAIAAFV